MSEIARDARLFPQRLVEDFVKQLNITLKACRLYPAASDLPRVSAERAVTALRRLFEYEPSVVVAVGREGLTIEGLAVFPNSESFAAFGREFYARRLCEVTFHPGAGVEDMTAFMQVLAMAPEDLFAQSGVGSVLWERGVSNISVLEVATHIVDGELPEEEREGSDEEADELDGRLLEDIIRSAGAGHSRDRRMLVRLLHDRRVVADYLSRSMRAVEGTPADASGIVKTVAHAMQGEIPGEQELALQALADSIERLDPKDRESLYRSRLLDEARSDESLAAVVRKLGADEVLDVLLAHADDSASSHRGLLRAIRNLSAVDVRAGSRSAAEAAGEKLRAHGFGESEVAEMLASASPERVGVLEPPRPAAVRPVESVLRLIGMTPDNSGVFVHDDAVRPLRDEATRGTTDGDVVSALVTIATLEDREVEFARAITLVENGLGLLAETHEFEVAAAAVEALTAACDRPGTSEKRCAEMRRAIRVLAQPHAMSDIVTALRLYKPDSPEYVACSRLLDLLGGLSVDAMLDVLAEEQDMAARKTVIQFLTRVAPRSIPQIGSRLADPRWYFVRNLVSLLVGTRSPEALTLLKRTLRHADPRVRRETIRGLAAFRTGMATSMLAGALADEDASNVQLAARLMGTLRATTMAGALEQVARGEGHGNREAAARIEAIGALVEMRATGALPTLRQLARGRGIMARRRDRDVAAAARSALRALDPAQRGEGGGS